MAIINALLAAALEIQEFLAQRQWRFCFIGGLAVVRWGEPRATQDIDLSLLSGFGDEESYIDPLLSRFRSRVDDARSFALTHRVLLLEAGNGTGMDVSLGGLPFEESIVERASPFEFAPDCVLLTCSAEDLIVLKAFAARPLDWRDIQGILTGQGERLDLGYVRSHLSPLAELKEEPAIMDRLESLLREEGLR